MALCKYCRTARTSALSLKDTTLWSSPSQGLLPERNKTLTVGGGVLWGGAGGMHSALPRRRRNHPLSVPFGLQVCTLFYMREMLIGGGGLHQEENAGNLLSVFGSRLFFLFFIALTWCCKPLQSRKKSVVKKLEVKSANELLKHSFFFSFKIKSPANACIRWEKVWMRAARPFWSLYSVCLSFLTTQHVGKSVCVGAMRL